MKLMATLALGVFSLSTAAASAQSNKAWSEPREPFKITSNIYYVGTKGLASYLIVSDKGAVLLDSVLKDETPVIERNIRALGFKLSDVKVIINTHAHFDHAGGLAKLKADTGATLAAMTEDAPALESGKHDSDQNYTGRFDPVKVDRLLRDGDKIKVGDVELTATSTPGHSKGCTSWSMISSDNGQSRRVVFPCSLSVAGNKLTGNKKYPGIAGDFQSSFDRLEAMQADIVLPAHPDIADLFARKAKHDAGDADAFVDRNFLQTFVKNSRAAFAKSQNAAKK